MNQFSINQFKQKLLCSAIPFQRKTTNMYKLPFCTPNIFKITTLPMLASGSSVFIKLILHCLAVLVQIIYTCPQLRQKTIDCNYNDQILFLHYFIQFPNILFLRDPLLNINMQNYSVISIFNTTIHIHISYIIQLSLPSKSIGKSPMGVLQTVAVERAHFGV